MITKKKRTKTAKVQPEPGWETKALRFEGNAPIEDDVGGGGGEEGGSFKLTLIILLTNYVP